MSEALEEDALQLALAALPAWSLKDDKLVRRFVLGDFREAMSFLVRVGSGLVGRGGTPGSQQTLSPENPG